MKILTVEPVLFSTGDVLPPEELNRVYQYPRDALVEVSARRWARGVLTFQSCVAVDTPYTNAMVGTEEVVWRFTPPVNCIIERGFLSGDLTCTADLQVVLLTAASALPAGATLPYLSTGAAVASITTDTTDINVDRVQLVAGTEYKLVITGGGTFTLNRLDITLLLAVDRWSVGGSLAAPLFAPTPFTDATGADASIVVSNNASLTTESAKLAASKVAPMPMLFVKHGLVALTPIASRKFSIPRQKSTRAQMKLKRFYLYGVTAGATTVSATLRDETGTAVAAFGTAGTLSVAVPGGGFASVDSGALAIALDGGDPGDNTKDYTIEFANSSATTGIKVYGIAWVART